MATLGGGIKQGRNGETGCQVSPTPHPPVAARGTSLLQVRSGEPQASLPRSGVPGTGGGGLCLMPSQQAGVSHLPCSSQPRCLRLGSSACSCLVFGQTSQNRLAWALLARQSPRSLPHLHPSLSFRADIPISQPIAVLGCNPHHLLSVAIPPQVAPDRTHPTEPVTGRPASCSLPPAEPGCQVNSLVMSVL